MSTFQFRLERVLEWYRTQLQMEASRLIACRAALNLVEDRIASLRAERIGVERKVISAASILARDLVSLGPYRVRTTREATEMEQELARREYALRYQSTVTQAAQRRVRLLEKLRDRRSSEHRYMEDRALEIVAAEAYL